MLCYIAVDVVINSTNENRLSGTQYGHDDKDCGKSQGHAKKDIHCIAQEEQRKPDDQEGKKLDQSETKSRNEALSPFFFHHLRRTLECSDRTEIFVSDHRYYKKSSNAPHNTNNSSDDLSYYSTVFLDGS